MKRLLLAFLLFSLCGCFFAESENVRPSASKEQKQVRGLPSMEEQERKRAMIIQMYQAKYGEEPTQREIHLIEGHPEDRIDQRMAEVRQMRINSDKRNKKR